MRDVRNISVNILLSFVWLFFAYENLTAFIEKPKLTLMLFFLAQTELIIFFILRKPTRNVTTKPGDYIVAIAGTFIALFFQPAAVLITPGAEYHAITHVADGLIYVAVILEICGFLSLNTSAGIVPANRGVKTTGLYKYVRHPIYSSYLLLYLGYAINNPSFYNGVILVAALILQIARIYREEALLKRDGSYKEYAAKVRWRLVPGVF